MLAQVEASVVLDCDSASCCRQYLHILGFTASGAAQGAMLRAPLGGVETILSRSHSPWWRTKLSQEMVSESSQGLTSHPPPQPCLARIEPLGFVRVGCHKL